MYIFHLGRQPYLSIHEIKSRYPQAEVKHVNHNLAFVEYDFEDITKVQDLLGGTQIISQEISTIGRELDDAAIIEYISEYIYQHLDTSSKINFGISTNIKELDRKMVFKIKKALKEHKISSRIIIGKPKISSVQILKEKMVGQKGAHIWIIRTENNIVISRSVSVQNIDNYSHRDYEKPFRSTQMGMLPPKLAQMMLNFAAPAQTVLDPFCGSGTILIEGLLMDLEIDGADINNDYVSGCKDNISWWKRNHPSKHTPTVWHNDAKNIDNMEYKYDAIVTEGFLGPLYKNLPSLKEQSKNFHDLLKIYHPFFKKALSILNEEFTIVLSLPAYQKNGKTNSMRPHLEKILPKEYTITNRSSFYGRDYQVVWREILIIKRKNKIEKEIINK